MGGRRPEGGGRSSRLALLAVACIMPPRAFPPVHSPCAISCPPCIIAHPRDHARPMEKGREQSMQQLDLLVHGRVGQHHRQVVVVEDPRLQKNGVWGGVVGGV